MVKFNKITKMGFLAQAGFRQLCRLWVPDLTSEEAPATDLSSITINIKKRKTKTVMFQIYIPCCLFVSVSWISFVIDPKVRFGDFPPL